MNATIEFKLSSGNVVTLFINSATQLAVVKSTKNPNITRVIDGIHNNGGWEVAEPYTKVITRIKALFA